MSSSGLNNLGTGANVLAIVGGAQLAGQIVTSIWSYGWDAYHQTDRPDMLDSLGSLKLALTILDARLNGSGTQNLSVNMQQLQLGLNDMAMLLMDLRGFLGPPPPPPPPSSSSSIPLPPPVTASNTTHHLYPPNPSSTSAQPYTTYQWPRKKEQVRRDLDRIRNFISIATFVLADDHMKLTEALNRTIDNIRASLIQHINDTTPIQVRVGEIRDILETVHGLTIAHIEDTRAMALPLGQLYGLLVGQSSGLDVVGCKIDEAKHAIMLAFDQRLGHIESMESAVVDMRESQKDSQSAEQRQTILGWLEKLGLEYKKKHGYACNKYTNGTGQWFVDNKAFVDWIDGRTERTKMLFCLGQPGAGKTVIASLVITHLSSKFKLRPEVGIAYCYCDYTQRPNQPEALLAALLVQFVVRTNRLSEQVKSFHTGHQNQNPSSHELSHVVRAVIRQFDRIFIVIDALDEWSEHDYQVNELLLLLQSLGSNVALLVTSRREFSASNAVFLPIFAREEDIKLYMKQALDRPDLSRRLAKFSKSEIVDSVASRSDGMFLMARLSLEVIQHEPSSMGAKWVLNHGTNSASEFYDHAIARLKADGQFELARHIFSWVVHSMRPLTVQEMQHAIALSRCPQLTDIEDGAVHVDDLVSACAGLIVVDEANEIHLIHYTAKQYFESPRAQEICLPNVHAKIAAVCLRYISICVPSLLKEEVVDKPDADFFQHIRLALDSLVYPFLPYAAHTWGLHARNTTQTEDQIRLDALHFFADKQRYRVASLLLLSQKQPGAFNHSPLHIAAYFDLPTIARQLVESETVPADSVDSNSRTPLSVAAEQGSIRVLDTLLHDCGADVNKADAHGNTPLAWAAKQGQNAIVHTLLGHSGVRMNSRNILGESLLGTAARHGHFRIVGMLWGAIARSADGHGCSIPEVVEMLPHNHPLLRSKGIHGTAIILAAMNGHVEIVDFLLEAGVCVNAQDNKGFTSLSRAAERGDTGVVQRLLADKRTQVDLKNNKGETALHVAASMGHERVVDMLLAKGAYVNARDNEGHTPLAKVSTIAKNCSPPGTATMRGRMVVLHRLLRQSDVEVDSKDDCGNTPLIGASGYWNVLTLPRKSWDASGGDGYESHFHEIAKTFMNHDANLNAHNFHGDTPIGCAARRGHLKIVKTLLRRGANANMANRVGMTPLICAVVGKHTEVVKELLRWDKSTINSKDHKGFTALCHAVRIGPAEMRIGHAEMAFLLMQSGADIDLPDPLSQNPLSHAAARGHKEVVQRLLKHGASAHHQSACRETTPLLLAVIKGHEEVVKILLKKHPYNLAVIDAKNAKGRTSLVYAAWHGHREIVEMLLAAGADVNAQDVQGRSALSYAAEGGHSTIVTTLLKQARIEVEHRDNKKRTALWYAASQKREKVVRILLGYSADVKAQDEDGHDPLWFASQEHGKNTVEALQSWKHLEFLRDMEQSVRSAEGYGSAPVGGPGYGYYDMPMGGYMVSTPPEGSPTEGFRTPLGDDGGDSQSATSNPSISAVIMDVGADSVTVNSFDGPTIPRIESGIVATNHSRSPSTEGSPTAVTRSAWSTPPRTKGNDTAASSSRSTPVGNGSATTNPLKSTPMSGTSPTTRSARSTSPEIEGSGAVSKSTPIGRKGKNGAMANPPKGTLVVVRGVSSTKHSAWSTPLKINGNGSTATIGVKGKSSATTRPLKGTPATSLGSGNAAGPMEETGVAFSVPLAHYRPERRKR